MSSLDQDGRMKHAWSERIGQAFGCVISRSQLAFLLVLSWFLILAPSLTVAQQRAPDPSLEGSDKGSLEITTTREEGYGRIVLNFAGRNLLPGYSIKQNNSVFVVRFDERMQSNTVATLAQILPDYVTVARLDPDGKGLRIALKEGVRINTMEAGERLFVDLLPQSWAGLPPSLPAEIVTELARRAEEALRLARSLQQQESATRVKPKLDVRIGDHPTFSRFAFIWNIPFDSTFERRGEAVNLFFNHQTDVDLSELRTSLPGLVRDMQMSMEEGRAKFTLIVAKNADVRAFRENNTYIIDITGDKSLFDAKGAEEHVTRAVSKPGDTGVLVAKGIDMTPRTVTIAPDGAQILGVADDLSASSGPSKLILGPTASGNVSEPFVEPVANQTVPQPQPQQQPAQAPEAGQPLPRPAEDPTSAVPAPQQPAMPPMPQPRAPLQATEQATEGDPIKPQMFQPAPVQQVTNPVQPATQPVPQPPQPAAPQSTDAAGATDETQPQTAMPAMVRSNAERMQGQGADLTSQSLRVEAKTFGRSVRLFFPFKNPTSSAVFRRNGVIWAVFDTVLDLDVAAAREHLSAFSDDIEVWRAGATAVLRIPMKNPRLVTFSPEGYGWLLTIGDMVVEPTKPLHMSRTKVSDGRSAMRVKFERSGTVLKLRDPGTGENLHVVTGFGPARGFVKGQRFVDFTALISAHGIALAEHVDDLLLARDEGYVYISSNRGLTISNAQPGAADVSALTNNGSRVRETFLNLDKLAAKTPVQFSRKRQDLERKLSNYTDLMAIQSQLALSKLLVANGYAFEALGHLQMIEDAAPEFARGKGFRTLYSAAELFAGRPESAFRRLNHPEFENDPDASVWRGLAAARSGRWREADDALDLAATVAQDYSMKVRQMMLLDGVEIAYLDQQFGSATAALAEVNPAYLDAQGVARYNLLRGKIAVARNDAQEASEAFKAARDTKYLPIANDAWLQDVKLRRQEDQINVDQAIEELEGLTTIWRGDEVELNALRTLAHYYVDKKEYRNAFETLKAAADSDPASEISRVLQEEMNAVFSSLFLDGKVNELSAIKALSLYYDFRELTPVGRRGDEMVRRLADKLVEVDLLDRASELLKHQVDNRLKGAARSQIAADLALIYLLDSKPNMALDTLRRTRQSQLPLSVERQRRLVEAKSLAQLNKVSLALDLLKPLQGGDVDQLRADIMWDAKRWQDVAEQTEMMLGDRWSLAAALDDQEQTNILRAGIAYSLADDKLGLDRLRRKYAEKMSATPVAGAFDVVTLPIERNGEEFHAVAQQIAGINTMERFLTEYRSRYLKGDDSKLAEEQAAPPEDVPPADNPQV
ncbi:hypothetical protein FDK21_02435 [Cohaesibacter sp. CAU 1516]|uniref:hypothetical protein n=1 Tax=Cohaesibacter sp. CAU 1516 TaxID=2576038 RepID=UPI0010FF3225|nr:hypothetical protein [Cohaesibacter sp. CAU 1516]TLP48538.1 hypothetical protein FDK21_02435 [Cohaesibacter sp. CAU 1516]